MQLGVRNHPVDLGANQDQLVYSPHDYGPLVFDQPWFQKPFDKASAQLMAALTTNEDLETVKFEFVRTKDGKRSVSQTVTLTGAALASFDQDSNDDADVETVSLTYASIQIDAAGGTTAKDDWQAPVS